MPDTISLCIIAKNEEHQIARCINSAKKYVDQIVVVDTGSEDNTVKIARDLGAEVYQIQWQHDFSQARNYSIQRATKDWILFLDCDEELDEKTAPLLRQVVQQKNYQGYWLYFINIIKGRPSSSFLSFRLFRNNPNYRFESPIHEQVLPSIVKHCSPDCIGQADITVYHYGYEQQEVDSKNKINRNITLLKKAKQEYGNAPFINFYLGVEYHRLEKYERALEYYLTALQKSSLSESYAPAMIRSIVFCLINLNNYQEGLNFINKYLPHYPQYTDLVYLKGYLYYLAGSYERALTSLNKCMAMGPPPKNYYSMSGIADEKARQLIYDIMEAVISQAAELCKQGYSSESFSLLNLVYLQLKRTPHRQLYIRLIETMLLLNGSLDRA
ncbi:glycosyltransferase family 2 protein [Desulfofalx alkaliphila]|uniref:glycosyltransferase family 2 protein n=1 Tax=Desulfofalx alkaliphila TaxID=105483 RepID=UPI0004E125B5|nr:glycosyltransferase family 2 protein [Desulfofalx alkaliphila]